MYTSMLLLWTSANVYLCVYVSMIINYIGAAMCYLKINVTMFTYACSIYYIASRVVCTKSELAWHICWKIQFLFFLSKECFFFAQIAFTFLKEIDCIQGDLGNVGHLKDNLVTEYLFIIF